MLIMTERYSNTNGTIKEHNERIANAPWFKKMQKKLVYIKGLPNSPWKNEQLDLWTDEFRKKEKKFESKNR